MKKATENDVLNAIRKETEKTSIRKVAARIGVSAPYLSDILLRRKGISNTIAAAFGFERKVEVVFRKVA